MLHVFQEIVLVVGSVAVISLGITFVAALLLAVVKVFRETWNK